MAQQAPKRVMELVGMNYSDSENESENEADESIDAIIVEKKITYEDVFGKNKLTIPAYTETLLGKSREEFVIPYPSKKPCLAETQAQTARFSEKVKNGFDITRSFETKREVRNPELYGKMVSYFEIDEFGTNFTSRFQYPEEYLDEDNFYDKLALEQNDAMAKQSSHGKNRSSNITSQQSRKTKWDSVGSSKPAPPPSASTTTSSTTRPSGVVVTKLSGVKSSSSSSKRH